MNSECFELQLSEVEMLQSMYSKDREFVIDDPSVIADVNDYVLQNGKSASFPSHIEFRINLIIDEKYHLELECSFPHDYPIHSEPEVFVRSSSLARTEQRRLNDDLNAFIGEVHQGGLCVVNTAQWLQENSFNYFTETEEKRRHSSGQSSKTEINLSPSTDDSRVDCLVRHWIYSHHIYNKMKRKTILDMAKDLDISGFCLPGKPGIICAEGSEENAEDYWSRLKHLNWKKIMCKKRECIELLEGETVDDHRLFSNFKEISFEVKKSKPGNEYHMDMGEFYKYLEQNNCGYAFKDYFGVDGKSLR